MRMMLALAVSATLVLSACSDRKPEPAPSENVPAATPTASVAPSGAAVSIPAAFKGRWGMVPGDCTSKRGDTKGLVTISADSLRFYESVAKPRNLSGSGAERLRGTFAFEGEGMTWKRDVAMKVAAGGKTLVMEEFGDDAVPGPRSYSRCP